MIRHLTIATRAQGLHEITDEVSAVVRHTSASLLIQENADPQVRRDLEHWFNRLAPENDALYTHQNEGPDDMPGHIKSALTATSLAIPIRDGKLVLGQWQGIFLWEHRHRGGGREVVAHIAT